MAFFLLLKNLVMAVDGLHNCSMDYTVRACMPQLRMPHVIRIQTVCKKD